MIDPETGADQWNVLRVAGKASPGVVKISGPGLVVGWDVQNASGNAGASTKRTGEPIKEFSAEFDLSNEVDDLNISDFDNWDAFQELLESSTASKTPQALEVYHPDLARNHITAVTLKSIGQMSLTTGGGGKIKVDFIEFRPPKPKPAAGAGKVVSKKTEGDKKIDGAVAELKGLQDEWKTL